MRPFEQARYVRALRAILGMALADVGHQLDFVVGQILTEPFGIRQKQNGPAD